MNAAFQSAAVICAVLALGTAALTLMRTYDIALAIGVLLDMLLASGLLRLAATSSFRDIVAAAAIVMIRKIVNVSFGGSSFRRTAGGSSPC